MYFDEIASARVVSESSLSDVLEHVRRTESTPPAWYVLAWSLSKADAAIAGGKLFGDVERLRFLSVLFAAAASLLTAMWALRLLGERLLAALAGFLVALGSVPAAYAEQLRGYALVMLLSVSFGLLLVRVADRPAAWPWCGLALCVWFGVMTHYFFVFVVAGGACGYGRPVRARLGGERQPSRWASVCSRFSPGFRAWSIKWSTVAIAGSAALRRSRWRPCRARSSSVPTGFSMASPDSRSLWHW
jgi:hypothetical protein